MKRKQADESLWPTFGSPLLQGIASAFLGRAKAIRQRFFAISVERKIKNTAVIAICEVARNKIFA